MSVTNAALQADSVVNVKCQAATGMFPHEAGVLIKGAEGMYEALIDSELVSTASGNRLSEQDQPASVRAIVVKVNGKGVLVELPRQVISGGRRIWVPISEVSQE